jgi:RND family efflux transporter MFP subunit
VSNQQSLTNANNAYANAVQSLQKLKLSDAQSLQSAQNQVQSALTNQQSTAAKDAQAVTNAQNQLVTAQSNLASGQQKDTQSIATAQNQVTSAKQSLASTVAANNVKAAPPTRATLAQSQASVTSAQANLANARLVLKQTTLLAPADGIVTAVNGVVGESSSTASAAAASGSTGFVTMISGGTLQVKAGFSESDAAKVQVGQPATITVAALPNQLLAARVVSVDATSTVVSNVVTYYVTLQLNQQQPRLKPGMTVTAQIIVGKRDGVIHVSTAAVQGTGSTGTVTVVGAKGVQSRRTVVVGLKGDDSTEIVSGLKVGDQVVVSSGLAATSGTAPTFRFPGGFGGGGFPRLGG